MKRFQFRLERVRRVRRVLDQQARQNLAGAIADRIAAETSLTDLRQTVRERIDEMAALQSSGEIDVRRVLQHEDDLVALGRVIELAEEVVEEAVVYEDECAAALTEARRELKVVESLREKAVLVHRDGVVKSELADLDESAARRHAVESTTAREDDR